MEHTILLLEDDTDLIDGLTYSLSREGYTVDVAQTAKTAYACLETREYSLLLLDVTLPDGNGMDVCRYVRGKGSQTPIIFLTAMDDEVNVIRGLDSGADDYITKPFNPLEVVARVKTQLRRYMRYNNSAPAKEEEICEYDIRGLTINKNSRKCFLFEKELQLTPIEFSILWYLCGHQGIVVSSEELFEAVWKEKYFNNNNTVMAHIGRLREKMKEPARNPKFIKTVWGVGYTIEK